MFLPLRAIGVTAAILLAAPAAAQPAPTSDEKTDLDKIGDTMENSGTQPLKDLNLIKAKVDPAIERIMTEP